MSRGLSVRPLGSTWSYGGGTGRLEHDGLYETFEPAEARRFLRRLEFHSTPKHASWLNMVEIEIGVMASQCLDRRIPTKAILIKEVTTWERARNRDKARIKWLFTVEKAREKLGRAYLAVRPQVGNRAAA